MKPPAPVTSTFGFSEDIVGGRGRDTQKICSRSYARLKAAHKTVPRKFKAATCNGGGFGVDSRKGCACRGRRKLIPNAHGEAFVLREVGRELLGNGDGVCIGDLLIY